MEDMKKLTEEEMTEVAGGRHHHHHHEEDVIERNEQRFSSLGHSDGELFQNHLNEWFYIVKIGDNMTDLANRFHTNVPQLMLRNPQIKDKRYIFPGDVLYICEEYETGFLG